MKHKKTAFRALLPALLAMVFVLAFTTFGASAATIPTSVSPSGISVTMNDNFTAGTTTVTSSMIDVSVSGYTFNDNYVNASTGDYTFSINYNSTTYSCTIPTYTVTYNTLYFGSLAPGSDTQFQGLSITLPTVTSSYDCTGWYTLTGQNVGEEGGSYTPTEGITLFAHYSDRYSAMFIVNGTLYGSSSGVAGDKIAKPYLVDPTKEGYSFVRFSTSPIINNGTYYVEGTSTFTDDVVYYAQWTPETYYYLLTGTGDSATYAISATNNSGSTALFDSTVPLDVSTKTNYVFVGWVDDATGVVYGTSGASVPYTIDGEATLTAKFAKDPDAYHTVSFIDQETNGVYESYYKFAEDNTVTAPAAPTKTGYAFGGWSDGTTTINPNDSVSFTADKVYHAVWTPLSYDVSLSADTYTYTITQNGSGSSQYNEEISLNVPTKVGYLFVGWKDNQNDITYGNLGDTSVDYTITGATTLSAIFVEDDNAYKLIKFINRETGQVYDFVYQNYGDQPTVTAPAAPTMDGYTFDKWINTTDNNDTVAASGFFTIDASTPDVVTYYAAWTAKDYYYWMTGTGSDAEYHVSLADGSGGSASSANIGDGVSLTTPTKTGYTFVGWIDSSDSTTYAYLGSDVPYVIAGETTLTPKFIEDVDYFKLVRFIDKDTGEVYGYYYRHFDDTSVTTPAAPPAKAGYTFVNWVNTLDSGDSLNASTVSDPVPVSFQNISTGEKDYYANWLADVQELSYSDEDASSSHVDSAFDSATRIAANLPAYRTGDVVTFDCTGNGTPGDAYDNVIPQPNYRIASLQITYKDESGVTQNVPLVPDENGLCTFTMPVTYTGNHTVTYDAVAVQSVFNISDQTGANLSAAAYLEGSDTSVTTAEAGDTVNVLFTPASGYALDEDTIRILNTANHQELTYTKVTDGSDTYYQFTMPAGDVEIHADAKYDAYNISLSTTNATVDSLTNVDSGAPIIDGVTPVPAGNTVSFGATANDGYTLSSVTVLDLSSNQYIPVVYDANNSVYTFKMPSANVKITVTAEKSKASLVILDYDNTLLGIEVVEDGSTVTVSGDTITVGSENYTASTLDGYTFSEWQKTADDTQFNSHTAISDYFIVKPVYVASGYNMKLADDSSSVAAVEVTYPNNTGVTLTTTGTTVYTGDNVEVTADPDPNYQITGVAVRAADGSTKVVETHLVSKDPTTGAWTYNFIMPAYAVEVAAYTEAIPYHLTVNEVAFPEGGTYTINGDTTTNADIKQGSTVSIPVVPEAGYRISNINIYYDIDGLGNMTYVKDSVNTGITYNSYNPSTENPYAITFKMPQADVTVDITYEKVDYSLTTHCVEDTWGSFDLVPTANVGDVINFTVFAKYGYNLKTLTIKYGTMAITPIVTATPTVNAAGTTYSYQFTMPASNVDLTATFVKNQYTVTFVDYDGKTLEMQTLDYLDKPSVPNIIPTKTGYHFTGWTKDATLENPGYGNPFVSDVFNTTQATTIYATYEVNNYGIDYVFDNAKGAVEGPANANYQAPVTVKVEPLTGYQINDVTATYLDANDVKQSITFTGTPTNMEDGGNYLFTMPAVKAGTNVTFTATFTEITRTVYLDEVDHATVTINKLAAEGDAEGVAAKYDSTVTIKITPETGYKLTALTVTAHDGISPDVTVSPAVVDAGGSYTFTMPAYDVDVNVTIDPIEYNVNWNNEAHSSISTDVSGCTIPGWYDYASTVDFDVTPNTGYQIKSVTAFYLDGSSNKKYVDLSYDQNADPKGAINYTFTMPVNDVSIVVVTEPIIYNVNVNVVGNGAYRLNDNDQDVTWTTAAYGSTVKITTEPDLGWEVTTVVADPAGDTIDDNSDGTYTLHMTEASDVTVTITYIQTTYNINYNTPANGTIDPKDATKQYQQEAKFTVNPADGYQIESVVGTYTDSTGHEQTITFDTKPTDMILGGEYTFAMPAADVDIEVTFKTNIYQIVSGTIIGNGELRLNSADTANIETNYGDTVIVTATPADGWYLESLTVTNDATHASVSYTPALDSTGGNYSFTMPSSNVTVTATFKEITYNISTDITYAGYGTITVQPTAVEDAKVDFDVTPNDGYDLKSVFVKDEDGKVVAISDGAYSFTMPAKNVTVYAVFEKHKYTVTFQDYDESAIGQDQLVPYQDAATEPTHPTRTGYTFTGWDQDFSSVTENMVITAEYQINTPTVTVTDTANGATSVDNDTPDYGSTVTVTADPADGYRFDSISVATAGGAPVPTSFITEDTNYVTTYTFSMPDDNVTVTVEYAEEASSDYTDVRTDDWFYEAVKFVTDRDYFQGVGGDLFAPNQTMTRAMFVTVLGRLYGVDPSAYTTSAFEDADINTWYGPYVAWAAENNIVNGYGDTDKDGKSEFGSNDNVTREQMAAIMYRYAEFGGYDLTGKNEEWMDKYSDSNLTSPYAYDAIAWCVGNGIIHGYSISETEWNIAPQGFATRAEVSQVVRNFVDKVIYK